MAHESIETAPENFYALYNNILKRHWHCNGATAITVKVEKCSMMVKFEMDLEMCIQVTSYVQEA